jgi:glycosyltransferase involved in cell wall biosynthesis
VASCSEIISIITICRNAASVIEATMLSVLTQTYSAIEYIIINGLSTDNTLQIAQSVASRFPERNVRIVSEQDSGISDAMNKGVLISSGTLLAHLHAGDRYIDATVIGKVMESFHREGWRWGVAGTIVLDPSGHPCHVSRLKSDYRRLLKQNIIWHPSTFLVREIFVQNGLFRVDLKQAMDYEFWVRIAFIGGERYKILPVLTTYFQEGGRSSQLSELLFYLRIVRREMRRLGYGCNYFDDLIFFSLIRAYSLRTHIRHVAARILGHRRRNPESSTAV